MFTDVYIKTEIDSLIANISISDYYNKTEIDDIGNELTTFILNNTCFTDSYNIEYMNTQFGLKANSLNTYTKSDIDNITTHLDISSIFNPINNNGTHIPFV